jgi:DNA-directed RNA polymerase subunit M/transcription elongation factor TFIIS
LSISRDEPLRNSSRKLIYESLSNLEKCENCEELDELKEITFNLEALLHDALFNLDEKKLKYFNRVKAIVSNLKNKNNLEFREKIIKGEIHLKDLIDMDVKDMASSEMQNKRKQAEDDGFKSRRSDWNSIHSSQSIGIYNCENCKSQKTTSYQMQIRGADEPMTT